MRRPLDDDDDEDARARWIWRFVRGALFSVLVSAAVVAALSIFVLPPPEPPAPEPEQTGPQMIGGIEVSSAPAYSVPSASPSDGGSGAPAAADAAAPAAEAAPDEPIGPVELSGPALVVNATPFEADPQAPLVAVVVDDTASAPLLHETLFAMDMPLTVGVVAGGGGDRITAEAAREAGFEVLAELPLVAPGQSAGGALEYGVSEEVAAEQALTLMRRLPMAVAVARPLAAQAPPNTSVLRGMLGALAPLGFAYVDHGLAQGEDSIAAQAAVGAVVGVSRFTIPAGADAAAAHSVLDRASATAERDGTAVVFAAPSEALILALDLWGGAGSVNLATPAPLSAVILRQQVGDLEQLFVSQPPQAPAPQSELLQAPQPQAPASRPQAGVPAAPAN